MKNSLSYSFGGTTCDLLMTDHQGSILALYKPDFTTTYTASYDVWGRQSVTSSVAGIRRGYCGHEHWGEFGVIDMNGRMYDPILGRFLSPDMFVQSPKNSQSFNRYSYCMNNPLKYTDPSGELFWLLPNIGWSKSGGFSLGLSFVVGLPGKCSAQAGIAYSFKDKGDLSAYVGASWNFMTVYASASQKSGFSAGGCIGASPYSGLPISTNFAVIGGGYNHKSDSGFANVFAWSVTKDNFSFDPNFSLSLGVIEYNKYRDGGEYVVGVDETSKGKLISKWRYVNLHLNKTKKEYTTQLTNNSNVSVINLDDDVVTYSINIPQRDITPTGDILSFDKNDIIQIESVNYDKATHKLDVSINTAMSISKDYRVVILATREFKLFNYFYSPKSVYKSWANTLKRYTK